MSDFAVVAGITVPVEPGGARKIPRRIGSQLRTWSGAMHESTRTWINRYEFRTRWITRAAANTLESALQGVPPISCSGDFFGGSVSCFVTDIGGIIEARMFVNGPMVIYEFALEEAS